MKWNILHESRGRIRLHLRKPRMSLAEADQLQDYLTNLPGVRTAAVYERTCDVVIVYTESRAGIVRGLAAFRFDTEALAEVPANSPRAVNREYQEKLVNMTIFHLARKLFLPAPLREEASEVLKQLRGLGIRKAVMMTGDNDRTASVIAKQVGVDHYYAEVLPEDKANFVEQEKAAGHTVIMLGDGINDSPALSAADVGIAISDGAAIAREIADVTIAADSLRELVILKSIANGLQKRTKSNYRFIMSFNSALIVLGAMGILPPATSALLHNASTLGVSLKSMTNLLD